MTLTSCKGKVILTDIKFGLTESQIKDEAIKLTRDKDLIMAIKDDDAPVTGACRRVLRP